MLKHKSIFNAVLKNKLEYIKSIEEIQNKGLPKHTDDPKNWDTLAALKLILKVCSNRKSKILDAGGEFYSAILPQLYCAGYKNLYCINTSFSHRRHMGNISYENGDITNTRFKKNYFRAVTCLSVIEHGVSIEKYFKEMSRILKSGGLLITSTDYWPTFVDTQNKYCFGFPIKIFTATEIKEIINIANKFGLHLVSPLELECADRVINWNIDDLDFNYTFIFFTLKKY